MSDKVLVVDSPDGVRRIILNRPEKRNALDAEVWEELDKAFTDAGDDPKVRVVVIKGNGLGFSAGNDLIKRRDREPGVELDRKHIQSRLDSCLKLWDMEKPVIVQVHGFAYGVASVFCNCADLVYIADDAVVGWPVLPLGGGMLSPTWAWTVGAHKAKELSFIIGSTVTGVEAAELGFANAAVPAAELEGKVDSVAKAIARVPADLLRIKKKANNFVFDHLGFRDVVRMGAAWDAIAHNSDGVAEARALMKKLGVAGAKDWYTSQAD